MTSKRMTEKKKNRWPHWSRRVDEAQKSGAAGAATQWDLARTYISQVVLAGNRGGQWLALAEVLTEFNTRFADAPSASLLGTEVLDTEGRNAGGERVLKAVTFAREGAEFTFDTARKFLRRIEEPDEQERNWRELEAILREFNDRFANDPTRAIARMATAHHHRT